MTDNFEKKVAVDGPVVNAGELGSSTFSPGQALPAGPLGLGQRWTVARKRERLLRDEPVQLLSRQLGVEIFRLEQWREKAIGGIDASLKQRKGDPVQAELDSAMKRIGELTMQVELLEAKTETFGPLGRRRSRRVPPPRPARVGLRPAAGLRRLGHGPLLVLRHDLRPARRAAAGKASGTEAREVRISDQALLVAIEADLEASPWEGEGYRKVWARLRVCRDIRVARKRVLRLMRENNLLSPHRCRRRGGNPHDGEIITHAPNLMWGTDGVRVFTVDDGWGWIFTAVEHWNAECVGWHVCKRGDRFAALQPISRGLPGCMARPRPARLGGWPCGWITAPSICRTTSPTRSSSGVQPSYAFVAEPQTNGVAERFNRTLKEQIIHGAHLPQHRGAAGRRPRLRRTLQCPVDRRKERLPEPRSSSSGVARRDLNQARRVRQTCVQGTGCR